MGRMSFIVSALLACAFAAVVLAGALLFNLFPGGPGGVAVATTRPPSTTGPSQTATPTVAPTSTPVPTPSPAPTFDPSTGGTYTVQPGDFLSAIGDRLGVPWQLIAEVNGIAGPDYVIVPGQVLTIPAVPEPTAGAEFHIVQSGDTITAIAQAYGVDPTDLADFNNIADWNSIRVGDRLFIPGPGWTPLPEPSF